MMGRTTKRYQFSTGEWDPAPFYGTIEDHINLAVPRTTAECIDQLRPWMSDADLPSYNAMYNALRRIPGVRVIKGKHTRFTTSTDAELAAMNTEARRPGMPPRHGPVFKWNDLTAYPCPCCVDEAA